MAALAGANLIYGAGMTESGVTFDYAQYVLDNDMARMVKHAVQGIPVNDETLDLDDIHAVGSFGDYLSLDSTLQAHARAQPAAVHGPPRARGLAGRWAPRTPTPPPRRRRSRSSRSTSREPLPGDVADEIDAVVHEAEVRGGVA